MIAVQSRDADAPCVEITPGRIADRELSASSPASIRNWCICI
jgi:hypothetical protein